MIQPKTIETIIKVAQPLIECGAISLEEVQKLKELQNCADKDSYEILNLKTIEEAAKTLRTTPKSIHELAKAGELEKIHFSRKKVLIPEASIASYIERHRNKSSVSGD